MERGKNQAISPESRIKSRGLRVKTPGLRKNSPQKAGSKETRPSSMVTNPAHEGQAGVGPGSPRGKHRYKLLESEQKEHRGRNWDGDKRKHSGEESCRQRCSQSPRNTEFRGRSENSERKCFMRIPSSDSSAAWNRPEGPRRGGGFGSSGELDKQGTRRVKGASLETSWRRARPARGIGANPVTCERDGKHTYRREAYPGEFVSHVGSRNRSPEVSMEAEPSAVKPVTCLLPKSKCALGLGIEEYAEHGIVTSPVIPSLADIMWVATCKEEIYTRFRNETVMSENEKKLSPSLPISTEMSLVSSFPGDEAVTGNHIPTNAEAFQKIAALECELMQLRSQIAMIVARQEMKSNNPCFDSLNLFDSPKSTLPRPSSTSTPVRFASPPPPPPPVPVTNLDSSSSASNLIKHRHAANKTSPVADENAGKEKAACIPCMMDVLKDLNKIRLRAVERSPGGTPITNKKKQSSLSDPAAFIAHALKQKFAHQDDDSSFGKENRSFEDSSFSSPETSRFKCHLLKPSVKHTTIGTKKVTVSSTVKFDAHL